MKTRFILASALMLLAFGNMKAQNQALTEGGKRVNTVFVNCTGDVTIRQSDQYVVAWDADDEWHDNYNMADTVVYLDGTADFDVTLHELNQLTLLSPGDVKSAGVLRGGDLSVTVTGTGDVKLNLDYDHVYVRILGTGDVELGGRCNTLVSFVSGTGDLDTRHLQCSDMRDTKTSELDMASFSDIMVELGETMQQLSDSVDWEKFGQDMEKWAEKMERWGEHMEKWGSRMERLGGKWDDRYTPPTRPEGPKPEPKKEHKKRSLLLNPHWTGVDAGLNLLLGKDFNANLGDDYDFLELRPLRSWVFNFNIADVGLAFDRYHRVGLHTGIGLGWNNYSLNRPVRVIKGNEHIEGEEIDEQATSTVKRSKLGVLYVQAPLMLEVRPTGSMFVALGVTGGVRVDTWSKVVFQNKESDKKHSDYYVNLFKLDATLRVGGDNLGFFASYNLLPLFTEQHGPEAHTLSLGLSLIF